MIPLFETSSVEFITAFLIVSFFLPFSNAKADLPRAAVFGMYPSLAFTTLSCSLGLFVLQVFHVTDGSEPMSGCGPGLTLVPCRRRAHLWFRYSSALFYRDTAFCLQLKGDNFRYAATVLELTGARYITWLPCGTLRNSSFFWLFLTVGQWAKRALSTIDGWV